jgi:hypothetical protein
MSDQLKQINVTYKPRQDRLLVKVSNSNDEEHRIWFTRRFTQLLMGVLDNNFLAESRAQGAVTEEAQAAYAEYQHIQNVKEESFAGKYKGKAENSVQSDDASEQVLERVVEPDDLLAHTIKHKARDDGGLTLSIVSDEQKTLTLKMNVNMKHQFYELLKRSLAMSDWFDSKTQTVPVTAATH